LAISDPGERPRVRGRKNRRTEIKRTRNKAKWRKFTAKKRSRQNLEASATQPGRSRSMFKFHRREDADHEEGSNHRSSMDWETRGRKGKPCDSQFREKDVDEKKSEKWCGKRGAEERGKFF